MSVDIPAIAKEFRKEELIALCQELGIHYELHEMARVFVKNIISDLEKNDIPDPFECSELMFNFLYIAKFIDENGDVLEAEHEVENVKQEQQAEKNVELPPCWGYEDAERDPACKKCKLQLECRKQKETLRPVCFGKLFSAVEDDCKNCLVAHFCKTQFAESVKIINSLPKGA